MANCGALVRSKLLTAVLAFVLVFAIVYQVHLRSFRETGSQYLADEKVDPWEVHGSSEEKSRPSEKRYNERVEHVKERCVHFSDNLYEDWANDRDTFMDVVVDEEKRIMFCGVPKAATTLMKRIFLKSSFPRYKDVPLDEIRDGPNGKLSTTHGQDLKYLHEYPVEQRKGIIRDYFKFMIVRPPLERLLSAYRDKTDPLSYTFYNKKVMDALKDRDLADEYIYFDVESFHQFLQFLMARTPRPLAEGEEIAEESNELIRSEMRVLDLCRPCSIDYDFIGKMETIDYDMDHLLKKLDLGVSWPRKDVTTNADYVRLYYHGFHQEHFSALYDLYKSDFELFEYSLPEVLQK